MSRLPLTERLAKPMRQPKELASWSQIKGERFADDRCLRYYYLPREELNRSLNLATGFGKFKEKDDGDIHLDAILEGLVDYEKVNGKVDAHVVTWRGLLTNVIALSRDSREEYEFNVVSFDGQIFIEHDYKAEQARKDAQKFPGQEKFMYAGYNFEKYATLEKPWGDCTRQAIEDRYKGTYESGYEYCVLVRSGVGSIKVAYGAEVDCVLGEKNPKDLLANYVELKTSKEIRHPKQAFNFENKLFRTWLQSFLGGIPKVTYGFRDDDFNLKSVEEYPTEKIPGMVKRSAQAQGKQPQWNGNDAIGFYAVFLSWIRDTVKPGETYKLRHRPRSQYLELEKHDLKVEGREVAFLSNDFVEWRRSQAKAAAEAAETTAAATDGATQVAVEATETS